MPDPGRSPKVFSIPVYRSFADALVTGLLAQHGRDRMTLARGMILVPNNRAIRAVTDAFVRRAEEGLLLPRIVAIGDAGEAPGVALDGADSDIPPAVDPLTRRMILARLVQQERSLAGQRVGAAEAVRLATEPGFALSLARMLASRLQLMTTYLADLKQQYADEDTQLGMVDTVLSALNRHSGERTQLGSERDPNPEY